MRDREVYAAMLRLVAPGGWSGVEVDLEGNALHIWLQRAAGAPVGYPERQTAQTIYDHRECECVSFWRACERSVAPSGQQRCAGDAAI